MKRTTIILLLVFNLGQLWSQDLEAYYQIAAENNPGLQAKYKDFEAAMKRVSQMGALADPTLSFGYFISPIETRVGPQRARLSLNQMFPWFGSLKARENVATYQAEAKYEAFMDSKGQLYFKVAAAYYQLYRREQWLKLERKNLELLKSYQNIATTKYENDQGKMVDVLRVDILLESARTDLEILEKEQTPLLTQFNRLLNRADTAQVAIPDTLAIKPQNITQDSVLANHPSIKRLNKLEEAGKAKEFAAKKQGYPKLGLGLDYAFISERNENVTDNGKDAIMPMLSVSLPIFSGKYKAEQEEAQLMQRSYQMQAEEGINQLQSRHQQLLFELRKQKDLIELYETQIRKSNQALQLLITEYSNNGSDFEEVLKMQQEVLKYKKLKVLAIAEHKSKMAELNYLTL